MQRFWLLLLKRRSIGKPKLDFFFSVIVAHIINNSYIDETGVMLRIVGSVRVFVRKDKLRDYKGAGVSGP